MRAACGVPAGSLRAPTAAIARQETGKSTESERLAEGRVGSVHALNDFKSRSAPGFHEALGGEQC